MHEDARLSASTAPSAAKRLVDMAIRHRQKITKAFTTEKSTGDPTRRLELTAALAKQVATVESLITRTDAAATDWGAAARMLRDGQVLPGDGEAQRLAARCIRLGVHGRDLHDLCRRVADAGRSAADRARTRLDDPTLRHAAVAAQFYARCAAVGFDQRKVDPDLRVAYSEGWKK